MNSSPTRRNSPVRGKSPTGTSEENENEALLLKYEKKMTGKIYSSLKDLMEKNIEKPPTEFKMVRSDKICPKCKKDSMYIQTTQYRSGDEGGKTEYICHTVGCGRISGL